MKDLKKILEWVLDILYQISNLSFLNLISAILNNKDLNK